MKLRNKYSGEVARRIDISTNDEIIIWVFDELHPIKYERLKDLVEDWEDYEPKEPLIKDEKIRKAVRAWAEANGFEEIEYWVNKEDADGFLWIEFRCGWAEICFFENDLGLDMNKYYTIAELCGEEE